MIGNHKFIGICLSKVNEPMNAEFFHAVARRAVECGYKVMVYNSCADLYKSTGYDIGEKAVFDLIDYDHLDGLIIMSETLKHIGVINEIVGKAKEHDLFTVSVDGTRYGDYYVSYDYRSAFEKIVRHLVEKHDVRVVNIMAGQKDNPFSDERIKCCVDILKEYGIEFDPERLMYGDFWNEPAERAMEEFFDSGMSLPDAFICCNDAMAMAVCSKLRSRGYTVPADCIVTGFDGIYEEEFFIPRLTTAKQNYDAAGVAAVDAIVKHNDGTLTETETVVQHRNIWSQSCGCTPVNYNDVSGLISPLFRQADEDALYELQMYDLSSAAAMATSMEELSLAICDFTLKYGYFYYAVSMNSDYMTIPDSFNQFVSGDDLAKKKERLVLCEMHDGLREMPYYSDTLKNMESTMETFNVYIHFMIHSQEKNLGYCVFAASTGCDGLYPNEDLRHIIEYSNNLSRLLDMANSKTVLQMVISRLQDLYVHDSTGLLNRRGFFSGVRKAVARAMNEPGKTSYMTVISVDMDGLKFINDSYGHSEGDAAIKAIADALHSINGESEICARFGGDEFTVASICHDDPEEWGRELVSRISAYISGFNERSGKPYKVGASYGISWGEITESFDIDGIIKASDDLMYRDKVSHKESRARQTAREM